MFSQGNENTAVVARHYVTWMPALVVSFFVCGSLVPLEAQEEAEEEIVVDYNGSGLEIGFNVSYLLDVLGVMGTEQVRLILSDSNSSALLQEVDNDDSAYVVMPMRL